MTNSLEKILKGLFNEEEIADVHFSIGKKSKNFFAHRVILASSSPVFKNLFFGGDWKEIALSLGQTQIKLPQFESSAFSLVLEYIYLRRMSKSIGSNNVFEILAICSEYQIEDLLDKCFAWLSKHLNRETCIKILESSLQHRRENLSQQTLNFIEKNSKELFTTERCFDFLNENTVKKILTSDNLECTEMGLYHRVVEYGRWCCNNFYQEETIPNLQNFLQDILPLVRFNLLSQDELEAIRKEGIADISSVLIDAENESGKCRRMKKSKEQIKVLLIAADEDKSFREDVRGTLKEYGIKSISTMTGTKSTPKITKLCNYDVIFLYSNNYFRDPVLLGNRLANFVEQGGNLIVCAYPALLNKNTRENLKGRLVSEGFLPIQKNKSILSKQVKLGRIVSRSSPILQGVKSFDCGEKSYHIATTLTDNSSAVALYTDGTTFIAEKCLKAGFGKVIVLNFFPHSSSIDSKFWKKNTDGGKIMANSIEYVVND
ncbi:btb (poz) domain-containing 2a-related [Anaeramoeba flamelloides]|uniref:Btb (Poz) domain-containing 2a-related n=1 Tax=Anaeramoeba flamelloides TaxID=1746091 RepID=A0ABQ8Y0H0_9EUKA|nr:btb (poz) domain-containing 2a-related [Anaeramoeba flamelloides]